MPTRNRKKGRSRGGRNRGFFFRAGRGWCTSEGTRAIALTDANGDKITDANADPDELKDALARYRLQKSAPTQAVVASDDGITVQRVCELYLQFCEANNAAATFDNRADALFDFCEGLPAAFRGTKYTANPEAAKQRIHDGYGQLTINQLLPLHIDQWLAKHPTWDGCKRTRIQAIKRALNYCVKAGVIARNPIRGYKVAKANKRTTYLTVEQEDACYKFARPALAMAIKVCIRTGARFGCEFTKLTAKHVSETSKCMLWTFKAAESKTRKERTIRITDPDIIAIVKGQIEKYPKGPIFRNSRGDAWKRNTLSQGFCALNRRLAKNGIELDDDACMYSCRHTYAKRTLAGHWTGEPASIEILCELMGNTRDVCWEHYAKWCAAYTDRLTACA